MIPIDLNWPQLNSFNREFASIWFNFGLFSNWKMRFSTFFDNLTKKSSILKKTKLVQCCLPGVRVFRRRNTTTSLSRIRIRPVSLTHLINTVRYFVDAAKCSDRSNLHTGHMYMQKNNVSMITTMKTKGTNKANFQISTLH